MTVAWLSNDCWQINAYQERYAMSADARQPLLLIPGWSCDARIFDSFLPGLAQHFVGYTADLIEAPDEYSFTQLCDQLAQLFFQHISQPAILFGWSLGGNIAVEMAVKQPNYVAALQLLACTPQFVASDSLPAAMPAATFNSFKQLFARDAVRGLRRFDQLQLHGLSDELGNISALAEALRYYRELQQAKPIMPLASAQTRQSCLRRGLEFLAEMNQLDAWQALAAESGRISYLLAENDALVNVELANQLATLTAAAPIPIVAKRLVGANHLSFLTHTAEIYQQLLTLQQQCQLPLAADKVRVAQSFSKAASRYDAAAKVQKRVASRLLSSLQASLDKLPNLASPRIVDAGCGTGYWTAQLAAISPKVTGVDFADGMLRYAKAHYPQVAHWLCDDLEHMQLVPGQTDIIFSSLAVQWCESLTPLLQHWYQLLAPGGQVFIATLGPKTLQELNQSFQQLDKLPHVNQFLTFQQIQAQLASSPFTVMAAEQYLEHDYYADVLELMHDLKNIGAQTVVHNQQPKPLNKTKLVALREAYQSFAQADGQLPASYDVIYLQLQKPA